MHTGLVGQLVGGVPSISALARVLPSELRHAPDRRIGSMLPLVGSKFHVCAG